MELRVRAYIDGFNLYFGLKDKGWRRYYWYDPVKLIEQLVKPPDQLELVKYFTARIASNCDKRRRQALYLDALATIPRLQVFEGAYLTKSATCRSCGVSWPVSKEKMSDVQLAIEMVSDGYQDLFDVAIVVSADTDQVPPVLAVQRLFPEKIVVVAFPPGRVSSDLRNRATRFRHIGRAELAASQLPGTVLATNGHPLVRPAKWA